MTKQEREIVEKGRALGYEGTIIKNGKLTDKFIDWISEKLPRQDPEFEKYLQNIPKIDTSDLVYYTCQDCGSKFPTGQGSRARFCDVCIGRRQREGWAKKRQQKG